MYKTIKHLSLGKECPMSKVSFEYAALFYLNQWLSKDCRFCNALNNSNSDYQLKILKEAAVFYNVARNLPRADKDGNLPDHYKGLLNILLAQSSVPSTEPELTAHLRSVNSEIMKEYMTNNEVISLTTKFMWFRFKHPVIVYDSRARKALRIKDGELEEYYVEWRKQFKINRGPIDAACSTLFELRQYSINPEAVTQSFAQNIIQSTWFAERVFDIYLWHTGA